MLRNVYLGFCVASVVCLGFLNPEPASCDLVSNGSFEQTSVPTSPPFHVYNPSDSAWTFSSRSGLVFGTGSTLQAPQPFPDGTQAAFLQYVDFGGQISQQLSFPSTGDYLLSYYVGGRQKQDNSGANGGQVDGNLTYDILLDGSNVASDSTSSFQQFTQKTVPFSATSGSHTLTFVATNTSLDHMGFFDGVSVSAVPEPSSFLACALAALLVLSPRISLRALRVQV